MNHCAIQSVAYAFICKMVFLQFWYQVLLINTTSEDKCFGWIVDIASQTIITNRYFLP
jgi:hypothetical protein